MNAFDAVEIAILCYFFFVVVACVRVGGCISDAEPIRMRTI